jgi:hypothetical protein
MKPSEDKKLREHVAAVMDALKEVRDWTDEAIDRLGDIQFDERWYDDLLTTNWRLDGCHSKMIVAMEALRPVSVVLFNHLRDERDKEVFGKMAAVAESA